MVKQDYQTAVAQATARQHRIEERKLLAAEQEEAAKPPRAVGGWQVVAVQCIACAVILLLALFVRVGGGSAYEELRQGFGEGLRSNDLMAALAQLWDGEPTDMLTSDPLEEDADRPPEQTPPNA